MMSYQEKQRLVIKEIEERFKRGETPSTIVQPVEDFAHDRQICLTCVEFIPEDIQEIMAHKLITPLKKADEKHYFYPPSSLHLTIQNIRTIHYPPLFTQEDIETARRVLREIVTQYTPPVFHLKDLFQLPWSLSVCAYSDKTYGDMVLHVREALNQAGVPDDKRYASGDIVLGNVTFCRYHKKPNNSFIEKTEELKSIDIGRIRAQNIFLITTNSVCHPDHTEIIDRFSFR